MNTNTKIIEYINTRIESDPETFGKRLAEVVLSPNQFDGVWFFELLRNQPKDVMCLYTQTLKLMLSREVKGWPLP